MTKFEIYLPDEDLERIFAIKDIQGKHDLTGNELAAELLHDAIFRLFPAIPQYDEAGNLINAKKYKGK